MMHPELWRKIIPQIVSNENLRQSRKKCCCFGCHRGRSLKPYKELVGTTIVRPGMIGVLTIGCQGGKRSKKIGFED
jgi:hypothetical protein